MKKLKVVIIDDERLARIKLKTLLTDYNEIDIIGEAKNAMDGIELINRLKRDGYVNPRLNHIRKAIGEYEGSNVTFEVMEAGDYRP